MSLYLENAWTGRKTQISKKNYLEMLRNLCFSSSFLLVKLFSTAAEPTPTPGVLGVALYANDPSQVAIFCRVCISGFENKTELSNYANYIQNMQTLMDDFFYFNNISFQSKLFAGFHVISQAFFCM
jgi:hypothetical protein